MNKHVIIHPACCWEWGSQKTFEHYIFIPSISWWQAVHQLDGRAARPGHPNRIGSAPRAVRKAGNLPGEMALTAAT